MADKTEKKPGFVARMKAAVKNFGNNVAKFFRDSKSELKKVVWPSGKQLVNNTLVVLVSVLIVGVIVCLFDMLAGLGIDLLSNLF